MNHTSAFIHPRPAGGYWAMIRLPKDAKAHPIRAPGGQPKMFWDAFQAQKAASDAVCAYFNGHLTRDGARLLDHLEAAEAVFRRAEDAHG